MNKENDNPLSVTAKSGEKKVRQLIGTVASAKMRKTVVVTVSRLKMHKKYRKQYLVSAKYKAHDEKGEYKKGDRVVIRESRPLSKEKRWVVVGRVNQKSNLILR